MAADLRARAQWHLIRFLEEYVPIDDGDDEDEGSSIHEIVAAVEDELPADYPPPTRAGVTRHEVIALTVHDLLANAAPYDDAAHQRDTPNSNDWEC